MAILSVSRVETMSDSTEAVFRVTRSHTFCDISGSRSPHNGLRWCDGDTCREFRVPHNSVISTVLDSFREVDLPLTSFLTTVVGLH